MYNATVLCRSKDHTLQQLFRNSLLVNIEATHLRFVVRNAPRALLEFMAVKDCALPMRYPSRTV